MVTRDISTTMQVLLLFLALLSCHVLRCTSSTLAALQSQLSDVKEVVPTANQLLQSTIQVQDDLLKILEHASYYVSSAKVTNPYNNRRRYALYEENVVDDIDHKFKSRFDDGVGARIDIDVVFVGFPTSAVSVIRDNWFDNLDRSDPLLASLGPFYDLKEALGGAYFDYNFHLVQVSFQVMDAIRNRIKAIMANFNTSTINVWEIDEVLDSLAKVIASTHTSSLKTPEGAKKIIQPSATMFVLNTQIPQVKYSNNFEHSLLMKAAADPQIVELCKQIVSAPKRKSKISEMASVSGSYSIQSIVVRGKNEVWANEPQNRPSLDSEGEGVDESYSTKGVHWRDAVKETKLWAIDEDSKTSSMLSTSTDILPGQQQHRRITRVLQASSGSFLSRHSLALASKILALSYTVSDPKDAAAKGGVGQDGKDNNNEKDDEGGVSSGSSSCYSAVRVSAGRSAWIDISADASSRPFHQIVGGVAPAPAPKIVDDKEWYSIGDETNTERNLNSQISSLKLMLLRHLKVAKHQYDNSDCTQMMYFLDSNQRAPGASHVQHLQTVLEYLLNEFHYGYTQSDCGLLTFEMVFLNVTVESVNDILLKESETPPEALDPSLEDMLKAILLKSLIQAVDLIGMYVETSGSYRDDGSEVRVSSSAAHKFLSDDVVVYLSHISSNILKLVRHFVSPPLDLSIPMDLKHDIRAFAAVSSSSSTAAAAAAAVISPVYKVVDEIASPSMHISKNKLSSINNHSQFGFKNNWGIFGDDFSSVAAVSSSATTQSLFHSIQPGLASSYKSYLHFKGAKDDDSSSSSSSMKNNNNNNNNFESKSIAAVCREDVNEALPSIAVDENIIYWASLKPFAIIPRKVDVSVYVIRTHKAYYPMSDFTGSSDGFDYGTFMTELKKLKFDNQDLIISFNVIDAFADDSNLAVSLDRCFMTGYVPISSGYYYSSHEVERKVYVDGGCVLSHIKKFDTTIEPDARHIPVYIISFDSKEPVLLNNQEQSIAIDESVIVAQNYQLNIKSSMCCGSGSSTIPSYLNGRNPVAPALRSTAMVLAGVGSAHQGHKGQSTTAQSLSTIIDFDSVMRRNQGDVNLAHVSKSSFCSERRNILDDFKHSKNTRVDPSQLWDWTTFSGDSPRFLIPQAGVPSFSELDVLLVFRSQVLRGVGLANAILSFELGSIVDKLVHYKEINDISRSQELVMDGKIQSYVRRVDSLIAAAMQSIALESWSAAAHYANSAVDAAVHPEDFVKFDSSELAFAYRSSDGSEGSGKSGGEGASYFDSGSKKQNTNDNNNNDRNRNSNDNAGNDMKLIDDTVYTATFFWVSIVFVASCLIAVVIYRYRASSREARRPVSFRNSI